MYSKDIDESYSLICYQSGPRPVVQAQQEVGVLDYVIAGIACALIVLITRIFSSNVVHWFLLPTIFCGLLLGADSVAWLRGKMDTFDVKGIIAVFGIHFFFLSPLIYVAAGLDTPYIKTPDDWRHWIGAMATLNAIGIVFYQIFQKWGQRGVKKFKRVWVVMPGRTGIILCSAILVAVIAEGYVLFRFGGLSGIVAAQFDDTATVFSGMGLPRIFSFALPLLCFFTLTIFSRLHAGLNKSRLAVLIILILFAMFQFIIAGLYSSRGLVVTGTVWVIILIHFFWRPIKAKELLLLFMPVLFLGWFYSFYKSLGPDLLKYVRGGISISDLSHQTGRSFAGMLIGDLSRVDIQAYIFYKLWEHPKSYRLRYGTTYIEDITPIIPYWIWRGKPADSGKVRAGTEILYGKRYYKAYTMRQSNRAYGLAGEMMLNFGIWGVPFAFAIWGYLVGRFRRYVRGLEPGDLRFLIVPFGIWFLPNMLSWDMDNYIAHTIIRAAFPILITYLMVGKIGRKSQAKA